MRLIVCMIMCVLLGAVCATAFGQIQPQPTVTLESSNQGDPRILVAVPDFAAAPGTESVAKEMTEVLKYDLLFSNLFKVLDRTEYPRTFTGFTSDPTQIDFPSWRPMNVRYIVYAYVTFQGNTIVAECRMFDVNSGTQAVGQRLTATKELPRLVAHRFSEEAVKVIDGVPGVASSQVVYTCRTSGGNKELFMADYDGQNARQLTHNNSISIQPLVSPDGKQVAYLSYKDRYPFLYVLDIGSGRSTLVSKHVGLNANPSWSPDGRSIALVLSKDGNNEIYLTSADGSSERRLTKNTAGDSAPTFDPTGRRIAFVSDRNGVPELWVMDANGGNQQRLSRGGKVYDPKWSPDGKKIAYIAETGGLQCHVMNADGSGDQQLSDASPCESPTWSPDSRNVMYSCHGKLFAANVQPYALHAMGMPGAACEGPSWGPRR